MEALYGGAFNAEIGDACIFGSEFLKLSDTTNGSRNFQPRIMEIQNIRNSPLGGGKFKMDLLDTSSTLDGRYTVIGPSSRIDSGATTTRLPLKRSFSTATRQKENKKWQRYIGQKIKIRNDDYSFSEEVTLVGFDSVRPDTMIISGVSIAPGEDYLVDMPSYSGGQSVKSLWKAVHAFACPEVSVIGSTGPTEIEVSASDISKFFVGSIIRVHNFDYSTDTARKKIKVGAISGNVLTVTDMGFTPISAFKIDLIGFNSDSGKPYRYL